MLSLVGEDPGQSLNIFVLEEGTEGQSIRAGDLY